MTITTATPHSAIHEATSPWSQDTHHRFTTTDGYRFEAWIFAGDGSAHIFHGGRQGENPHGDSTLFTTRGRDTTVTLLTDGPHMTKDDIRRAFAR